MARGISKVCIRPADSNCCKECSLHHLPPCITRKRVHQLKRHVLCSHRPGVIKGYLLLCPCQRFTSGPSSGAALEYAAKG